MAPNQTEAGPAVGSGSPQPFRNEIAGPGDDELQSPTSPPPKALEIEITGPFAHFRKVDTSQTRLTYHVPPRSTIMGLLAAIVGYDTNSYYQAFQRTNSAIGIEIDSPLRTYSLPINYLGVEDGTTESKGSKRSLKIKLQTEGDGNTQRVNHQVLRNPTYRLYVWTANTRFYNALKSHLQNGTSIYTPSLGLSEHIASINYHGEHIPERIPEDETPTDVDSVVPDGAGQIYRPDDGVVQTEQAPAEMKRIETPLPNRKTTDFMTVHFQESGDPIPVQTQYATRTNGSTVIFS